MKKAKKKAKKAQRKYTTISLYFSREQKQALDNIAEWADREVDDVVSVLLGVAMFMGRCTYVAAQPPQVAPDGEPPPAPAPDPAPNPDSQP